MRAERIDEDGGEAHLRLTVEIGIYRRPHVSVTEPVIASKYCTTSSSSSEAMPHQQLSITLGQRVHMRAARAHSGIGVFPFQYVG